MQGYLTISLLPVVGRRETVGPFYRIRRLSMMMNIGKNAIAVLVVSLLIAGLSGCKKEGPMERTGREIDKAAEKTGEKLEKAGEKVKESVK